MEKQQLFHGGTYNASTETSSALSIHGTGTVYITGGTYNHTHTCGSSDAIDSSAISINGSNSGTLVVNMSGGTVTKRGYGPYGIDLYNYARLNFWGSAYVYTGDALGTKFVYNVHVDSTSTFNKTGGTVEKSGNGKGDGWNTQ